jgi:hypothetical protein
LQQIPGYFKDTEGSNLELAIELAGDVFQLDSLKREMP